MIILKNGFLAASTSMLENNLVDFLTQHLHNVDIMSRLVKNHENIKKAKRCITISKIQITDLNIGANFTI